MLEILLSVINLTLNFIYWTERCGNLILPCLQCVKSSLLFNFDYCIFLCQGEILFEQNGTFQLSSVTKYTPMLFRIWCFRNCVTALKKKFVMKILYGQDLTFNNFTKFFQCFFRHFIKSRVHSSYTAIFKQPIRLTHPCLMINRKSLLLEVLIPH